MSNEYKRKESENAGKKMEKKENFFPLFPPFGIVACLDSLGVKEKDPWLSEAYRNSSLSVQMSPHRSPFVFSIPTPFVHDKLAIGGRGTMSIIQFDEQ